MTPIWPCLTPICACFNPTWPLDPYLTMNYPFLRLFGPHVTLPRGHCLQNDAVALPRMKSSAKRAIHVCNLWFAQAHIDPVNVRSSNWHRTVVWLFDALQLSLIAAINSELRGLSGHRSYRHKLTRSSVPRSWRFISTQVHIDQSIFDRFADTVQKYQHISMEIGGRANYLISCRFVADHIER